MQDLYAGPCISGTLLNIPEEEADVCSAERPFVKLHKCLRHFLEFSAGNDRNCEGSCWSLTGKEKVFLSRLPKAWLY